MTDLELNLNLSTYVPVPIWVLALIVFLAGLLVGKALFAPRSERRPRVRPAVPPEPRTSQPPPRFP